MRGGRGETVREGGGKREVGQREPKGRDEQGTGGQQ
jgi:hypothetical protein